ncbi:MAG: aspartate/glutamate racemase family protein [Pseudomonadota bacterium]
MKILILPPYQNKNGYTYCQARELMENLEKKGQITREEYVIDEGYFVDWMEERRDAEFLANISLGIIRKVKGYSRTGEVDAIVSMGSMEPAFYPAREICDIPYMGALHSALHAASLLGERCSVIEATDPQAQLARRHARMYGFDAKMVSARHAGHSSSLMGKYIDETPKAERADVPEVRKIIDDIVGQCVAAVEHDGADAVILSCMPLQVFEDEVRRDFDRAGFEAIPVICELSASVAMAKAVAGMALSQARVAHPRSDTAIKPAVR